MTDKPRFSIPDRIWPRALVLVALAFLVLFFAYQIEGLRSLWNLLRDAAGSVPEFVRGIVDYFSSLPADRLLPSALVGAAFGAVATALVSNTLAVANRQRGLAIGAGAVVGGLGAQILMYPTQHCTYAPDVDSTQFRMGLFVTALSALILLVPLWTLLRRRPETPRQRVAGHFNNFGLAYLFLVPTLVMLAVFLYYPAIQVMLVSLRRKIFPLPQEQFACMQNFVSLTDNAVYRNSFTTTMFITFWIVLFSLALALGIAVLASQKIKYAGFYRTLLIWPYAISPVVTGVIFLSMFREGGAGLLNWMLDSTLGITPHWLTDKNLAPWVIIAASVWNLLGFNVLFYIAGLQNVPEDLLEAASLDGAGRFRRFWRITFPLLSPFTFFLLVTNITYSFYGIYGMVDTLTPEGGPRFGPGGESGATNVLIFKLYKDAFDTGAPAGVGAAQAVILFLMVAGLMVLQFRFIERRITYEA
jgi:sn-glycerol 3-phosphate transport system permease protein